MSCDRYDAKCSGMNLVRKDESVSLNVLFMSKQTNAARCAESATHPAKERWTNVRGER